MTRRGVVRWAGRAFARRPVTVVCCRDHRGACCVEVEVIVRGTWSDEVVYRWVTGASWGDCVRKLEEHFMFEEIVEDLRFSAQLVPFEQAERCLLRVLEGAPRRDVTTTAHLRLVQRAQDAITHETRDYLRAVLRQR